MWACCCSTAYWRDGLDLGPSCTFSSSCKILGALTSWDLGHFQAPSKSLPYQSFSLTQQDPLQFLTVHWMFRVLKTVSDSMECTCSQHQNGSLLKGPSRDGIATPRTHFKCEVSTNSLLVFAFRVCVSLVAPAFKNRRTFTFPETILLHALPSWG